METYSTLHALVDRDVSLAIVVFSSLYVLKHTFCIPGGSLMNALAGALFGLPIAVPLCATLSAIGGSSCFLLSRTCGAPLLDRWHLEARVAPLRRRVEEAAAKGSLPRLLVSLRLVPLLPQWAVNVVAPHTGIPLPLFALTTATGLFPYCAATCGAGAALASALESGASPAALLPPKVLAFLCLAACTVAFGPAAVDALRARCSGLPGVATLVGPPLAATAGKAEPGSESV